MDLSNNYWCREEQPRALRDSLCPIYLDFFRARNQIVRDIGLSKTISISLNHGGYAHATVPDPEARLKAFVRLWIDLLRSTCGAWAVYLGDVRQLRGDRAVKAFDEAASEFLQACCDVVGSELFGRGIAEYHKIGVEVIAAQLEEMKTRWPGPGRRRRKPINGGQGVLVNELNLLLSTTFQGKKGTLALEIAVDHKTLNKILRGESVTSTTIDKVRAAVLRLNRR